MQGSSQETDFENEEKTLCPGIDGKGIKSRFRAIKDMCNSLLFKTTKEPHTNAKQNVALLLCSGVLSEPNRSTPSSAASSLALSQ